jgi:hypothetical protein
MDSTCSKSADVRPRRARYSVRPPEGDAWICEGRRIHFWAVIEAQGREAELSGFGIVEIVANDENDRIDVSQRCMRIPMGVYVNVFVSISQEEAKLLAYSDGFGCKFVPATKLPFSLE